MSSSTRTDNFALILGSGPGLGTHIASIFASKRFNRIGLVARNKTQLEKDAKTISELASDTIIVKAYPTDMTDEHALENTLAQVTKDLGTPEFVLYNAALVRPSALLKFSVEDILMDLKISTLSLYITAKWAVPLLASLAATDDTAKPTLMVTSSHLPEDPVANLFSLSLSKASQKNLTRSLREQFGDKVHICLLTVAGTVIETNQKLNPDHISEKAWELFDQDHESWTEDIRIEEP